MGCLQYHVAESNRKGNRHWRDETDRIWGGFFLGVAELYQAPPLVQWICMKGKGFAPFGGFLLSQLEIIDRIEHYLHFLDEIVATAMTIKRKHLPHVTNSWKLHGRAV